MFPKVFYGTEPKLTAKDKRCFDRNGYRCTDLFTASDGSPVIVAGRDEDGIWKVQYGFSTIMFGTRKEALNYCRRRFPNAKGA